MTKLTRRWSEEEVKILKKHYGKMPTRELARVLGRSMNAVNQKARTLNLAFPRGSMIDYELLKKLEEIYEG